MRCQMDRDESWNTPQRSPCKSKKKRRHPPKPKHACFWPPLQIVAVLNLIVFRSFCGQIGELWPAPALRKAPARQMRMRGLPWPLRGWSPDEFVVKPGHFWRIVMSIIDYYSEVLQCCSGCWAGYTAFIFWGSPKPFTPPFQSRWWWLLSARLGERNVAIRYGSDVLVCVHSFVGQRLQMMMRHHSRVAEEFIGWLLISPKMHTNMKAPILHVGKHQTNHKESQTAKINTSAFLVLYTGTAFYRATNCHFASLHQKPRSAL